MGYSCSAAAELTREALFLELKSDGSLINGNSWRHKSKEYSFEQGREQSDGAITGTVWSIIPDGQWKGHCKRAGSVRIEANGEIKRFPCVPKEYWKRAEAVCLAKFLQRYGEKQAEFEGISQRYAAGVFR